MKKVENKYKKILTRLKKNAEEQVNTRNFEDAEYYNRLLADIEMIEKEFKE